MQLLVVSGNAEHSLLGFVVSSGGELDLQDGTTSGSKSVQWLLGHLDFKDTIGMVPMEARGF